MLQTTTSNKLFIHLYKTIVCCIIFFSCLTYRASAQNTDSIRAVLNAGKANDTTRINLYKQLALAYQDANPDSVLQIAARGLAFSEAVHSDKGKAAFYRLNGLAWYRKNDFNKSLAAYNTSLVLFQKAGIPLGQSSVLLSIADVYYRQANYSVAIEYYNKGITIGEESNNFINVGLGLISIGGIYSDLGSYSEALKYYLKGLTVFEKTTYAPGISMSYTNLAIIYSNMGNYPLALDYINKCKDMGESAGDKESVLYNLVNASNVYGRMNDNKNALATSKKALQLASTLGDDSWKNVCRSNIADIYYQMGYYDSALVEFTAALKKADSVKDVVTQVAAHKGIGLIAGKHGNIPLSIKELKLSFDLAKANGIKESILNGAMDLGNAYERAHDYRNAMQYHDVYYDYKDTVFSDKNKRHLQQIQFDYELNKKQQELEQQKTASHARRERNRLIVWSLVAGMVLLAVIIVLLYRSRIYERRNKEKLIQQNKEIEEQASKLKDLNHFKDKTFSVLSHDLRGPVNSFTSTVMMLNDEQITTEEFNTMKPEITRQVNSLNLLLDNVLGWARSHMQEDIPVRPVKTNIYHIAQQNMQMLQDGAERKEIAITNNIAQDTYAVCDVAQIDIVLRNLLMNAIKYTNRNGSITLTATTGEQEVQISVTDTGIGMSQEQISKLFITQQNNTNTYGTEGEKGIGLGLVLCYEFVKANKGSITVTSESGQGSTFTVSLPRFKAV